MINLDTTLTPSQTSPLAGEGFFWWFLLNPTPPLVRRRGVKVPSPFLQGEGRVGFLPFHFPLSRRRKLKFLPFLQGEGRVGFCFLKITINHSIPK